MRHSPNQLRRIDAGPRRFAPGHARPADSQGRVARIAARIQQITGGALSIEQGALYPALYRLERQRLLAAEWGTSANNRRAKFYRLTNAGRARLRTEAAGWKRLVGAMTTALETRAEET